MGGTTASSEQQEDSALTHAVSSRSGEHRSYRALKCTADRLQLLSIPAPITPLNKEHADLIMYLSILHLDSYFHMLVFTF